MACTIVPLSTLIELYKKHGSVHKVGELVGIHGSSVHERLQKEGITENNFFIPSDLERLKREYHIYADAGKLDILARSMGRTKVVICARARKLGLTKQNRKRPYIATWKYMSEETARVIFEQFKKSSLGMGQYCHKKGYDDLGFSKTMKKYFPDEWEYVIESKVPRQTKYRVGREFEYRTRNHLRKLGYFVLRSPRSGSPVDLVAIKTGKVVFVQCKRNGSFMVAEWNEFFDLCLSTGALPVLASTPTGRGIDYYLLLGRKDGSKRKQPMRAWEPNN